MTTQMIIGILIPFAGTTLGAAMVFLLKDRVSNKLQRILTGFAAGVMVAASFWSLLNPALESSESMGKLSFIPAAVGFLIGIGFLLLLDVITPHMHMNQEGEGPKSGFKRTTKLILAVTLHNIPEGMAVGILYAGWLSGSADPCGNSSQHSRRNGRRCRLCQYNWRKQPYQHGRSFGSCNRYCHSEFP